MASQESLPALGTFTRVHSVLEAGSLGFMPTTHQEKNSALTLADYLESPVKYPGGVHSHLMEIYDHQVRIYKEQEKGGGQARILAKASVESVLYTYGDHLANARRSFKQLSLAKWAIDEATKPSLPIGEAFDDVGVTRESAFPLVRYVDLSRFVKKDWPYSFDPLLTVENRKNPLPSANKRIEDVYTGENDRVVSERIEEFLAETTIGAVRGVADKAIDDQVMRGFFWRRVLEGAKGGYGQVANTIITTAHIKPEDA